MKKIKIDNIKIAYYLLIAVVIAGAVGISYLRVFEEFELSMLDMRYKLRPPQKVDKSIVIVEIGDDSIEKLGKWPFPRNYHALLTNALKKAGTDQIIFDVFFSEEKEDDAVFAEAVEKAGNVYLPYVFELVRDGSDKTRTYASGYAAPLVEVLAKSAYGTGFVNVEPDIDGKVRKMPPFIDYNGTYYPNISFRAAIDRLGYSFDKVAIVPGKYILLGADIIIPLTGKSSLLVNYPNTWGKAFRHYSYVDIIQSYLADVMKQEPVLDLNELKNTVCMIGFTAVASPDAHPSPMEPLYPGVGVHASVYNSILQGGFIRRLNRWWNLLILMVMWIITVYATAHSRKRFAVLSILLILLSYFVIALLLFWPGGIWIDMFYPMITIGGVYVVVTFKKYMGELQRRELLEKELEIARDIQRSFLPKEIPQVGGISFYAHMLTAKQVGGDLYDVIQLDEHRLGVMIGDVSGKGVPAALYMANVVSAFKTAAKGLTTAEVLKQVNDRLSVESTSNLFVTVTYMIIDTEKKEISYSIGGHLPTVMVDASGNVELLDAEEGMPLGMIECDFSQEKYTYKPGSLFVLCTDGVTEALNTKNDMFGQDRLVAIAEKLSGESTEKVVKKVHAEVEKFAGKAEQHDDITVIAIRT